MENSLVVLLLQIKHWIQT